ncbi:hypothetical protein SSCHL_1244 [Staphylococcus schleiferi]|nr:hypothetical protein SSCHL_1244 [Staphylococcus schleiferi]
MVFTKKKFCSKKGFTLPLLLVIFTAYFSFNAFYLMIYSLKLQAIDAISDDYEHHIRQTIEKGE